MMQKLQPNEQLMFKKLMKFKKKLLIITKNITILMILFLRCFQTLI